METDQKIFQNFLPLPENQQLKIFFKNFFFLAQKMRLEISGGPLGVKFGLRGHLGAGKGEKHPLGQNCPKADATIKKYIISHVVLNFSLKSLEYP